MLDQIAANHVGAVFAANISRLSRQLLDFEEFRVLAASHKVLLFTDGRVIDPADSNDTVLTQVTATIFQFENRKRAEVMRQARMTKARQGIVVSQVPVGWVKRPDGKFDYDPRVKDVIKHVFETFRRERILRRTVATLNREGTRAPSKHGARSSGARPLS
jgi:DNA invertase Pin-like site-specific DNA recombinase